MAIKAVVALVLLACLAVQGKRELTAVDGPGFWYKCNAASGLAIKVQYGSCSAITRASCTAIAKAMEVTKGDFAIFQSNSVCDSGAVKAHAKAIATAIAKIWVSALVKVKCQGVGNFACGWAFANGNAWAHSIARAYALAIADIWTHKGSAYCTADVIAISHVIAEAAASAQADVCITKGSAVDFEKKFASSVAKAIAKATARAASALCAKNGKFVAKSECSGSASSGSDIDNTSSGPGASATGRQVKPCLGPIVKKCCYSGKRFCRSPCSSCGLWYKTREVGKAGNEFWRNGSRGEICVCPAPKRGH